MIYLTERFRKGGKKKNAQGNTGRPQGQFQNSNKHSSRLYNAQFIERRQESTELYIQAKSGRVAFPRAKVKPATPAALGVAEAPERRATRAEVRTREAAMVMFYRMVYMN